MEFSRQQTGLEGNPGNHSGRNFSTGFGGAVVQYATASASLNIAFYLFQIDIGKSYPAPATGNRINDRIIKSAEHGLVS